jgi:hypothetical protein
MVPSRLNDIAENLAALKDAFGQHGQAFLEEDAAMYSLSTLSVGIVVCEKS